MTTTITKPKAEDMLFSQRGSRYGLIVDRIRAFEDAGGRITEGATPWAVLPDGRAFPLLCGDFVWVDTEDGRVDGRCLARAYDGACETHAAQRDAWMSLSEAEKAHVERMEDERDRWY